AGTFPESEYPDVSPARGIELLERQRQQSRFPKLQPSADCLVQVSLLLSTWTPVLEAEDQFCGVKKGCTSSRKRRNSTALPKRFELLCSCGKGNSWRLYLGRSKWSKNKNSRGLAHQFHPSVRLNCSWCLSDSGASATVGSSYRYGTSRAANKRGGLAQSAGGLCAPRLATFEKRVGAAFQKPTYQPISLKFFALRAYNDTPDIPILNPAAKYATLQKELGRTHHSMGDREAVQRLPGSLPAIGKPATGSSPDNSLDKSAHKPSTWMRRTIHIAGKIEPFFGTLDENVRFLEDALHVRTHLHDTKLTIEGGQDSVEQAVRIVEEYNHAASHGRQLTGEEVKSLMRVVLHAPDEAARGMFEHGKTRAFGKKQVTPKNSSQRRYMEEIEAHDMVFGIGPGGTGKTYIAVAMAVSALLTKQVNRIILARPAVEAGEK